MIAIDSSALVAILRLEPEAERFIRIIVSNRCVISALSLLETAMVLTGRAPEHAFSPLDEFVEEAAIEIAPFDDHQLLFARSAYFRYGKGRHPAALNMGDCISYALARSRGCPLLFKGTDFGRTDIEPACDAR